MVILPTMQTADALLPVLEKHVPPGAVAYCLELWQQDPFHFVLRRTRVTKLGDFSCRPGRPPRITVNADIHPFLFLLTFIHEVAHLRVHRRRGWHAAPHGQEWKESFRDLCAPLFSINLLPASLAEALRDHLRNPSASSQTDLRLSHALRELDQSKSPGLVLADLPEGSKFHIRGRWFQKGKHKRTRVLCREVASRRHYLIPANAPIGEY